MNIYLVRHGLSTGNVDGRLQGWLDTDLAPAGFEQARKTAQFFDYFRGKQRTNFTAIHSSPLRRAWLTALAISERLDIQPLADPDLKEMHAGQVQGLRLDEWQQLHPEIVPRWLDRADMSFGWPGGETRQAFRSRCLRAISNIVANHGPNDNVIVVTHGGFIRGYLVAAGLIEPNGGEHADNCSITYVQYMADPGGGSEIWGMGCLRAFNQVSHLHEELGTALLADTNADLVLS